MIYTVTLNPTIDRSLSLSFNLIPGGLNRAMLQKVSAGGKGINCAEAASAMGVATAAYTVIGKDNIEEFEKSTVDLSSEVRAEMKNGITRTCIKLYNPGGMVTECNEYGSKLTESDMRALMTRILTDMRGEGNPSFLLLSGSIPPGVESGVYADMVALFKKLGVKVMLDCDGLALKKGIAASPYLVKPNLSELEELLEKPLPKLDDIVLAAKDLSLSYNTKVLVTLGGDGMVYADSENGKLLHVMVPDLAASTTVGAGDTVLGVFAACLEKGLEIEKSLQLAAAAACAKVKGAPGQFPNRKEAIPYLPQIFVEEISEQMPEEEEESIGDLSAQEVPAPQDQNFAQ